MINIIENELIPNKSTIQDLTSTNVNNKMRMIKSHKEQKRKLTVDVRNHKIDDNKLLEVNRKKVVLFQYLSKIKKEKKNTKEQNGILDIIKSKINKRPIKTNEEIFQQKETRRRKRLLQNKKRKKEEKKKQKKQKNNYLIANNYLKNITYEDYDINHIKEIKSWLMFLKDKIRRIFPVYALNIDFLIKQFEIFFNMNLNKSVDTSISELGRLRNFNGVEVKTKINKSQINNEDENSTKMDNEQMLKIAKEQKKLLDDLMKKERNFFKSKEDTTSFLTNMKGYENALKDKNYYLMQNTFTPTPGEDEEDEKETLSQHQNMKEKKLENALDPREANKLKERVINFTLKTFDKFSLKRIVEYWIENAEKLQEKKTRDIHYKYQTVDVEEENEEVERKKKQKAINVKHIYSTPTNEVLQIIPFCSKKYTIQKKGG